MQVLGGQVVYSATDLVGFLACRHLTNLEHAAAARLTQKPMRADPELDRIAKRGLQHEARFLAELDQPGIDVTQIEPDASIPEPGDRLKEAAAHTIEAMRRGDDIIYQAAFFDGRSRGHPDFLIKVARQSDLGDWSYEVWDTKLARHAQGSAVLQLCHYSDLLGQVQGLKPERMYLALGGSEAQKVELRVDDYAAYYRLVKAEFERLLREREPAYPPATRPDPVEHCDVCRWSEVCRKELRSSDDLSLVAGISASQRRLLRERGVPTRSALAALPLPLDPPLRWSNPQGLIRIREQARVQVEGDKAGKVISEILDPSRTRDGGLEPGKGLLSLPEPSPGDLFFDIEGDPFALEDGIDYLFGVLEPRLLDDGGQPTFHRFWAVDAENEVTLEAERKAFEAFIDLVMDRLEQDSKLHVYHYAPYEPTAVRRLMGRYGTREDEVDSLLRSGVFVDLFHAARQGIRASVESYSIKRLEPLYGFERTIDLRDAGSSIVAFETWLELGGAAEDDPQILQRIEDYNKDDCVSTWLLRDWLEEQRSRLSITISDALPRPVRRSSDVVNEELTESLAQTLRLMEGLLAGVPDDVSSRSPDEQGRWLLAQLLSWHRREEKSIWWRYFYLLDALTDEDRISEPDALGQLTAEGPVGQEKQSIIYRFRFPAQDHKIAVGSIPRDATTGNRAGTVVTIDDENGIIDLKRGKSSDPPEPTSLIPLEYISTKELQNSLNRLAAWVTEHGIDSAGPYRAARNLLMRKPPGVSQPPGTNLVGSYERPDEAARRLALLLDNSYLAVQGPPGSGKTTVGAEMIADLVAAGKRVGVTATSHKVIGQLLAKTADVAANRALSIRIGKLGSAEDPSDGDIAIPYGSPAAARDALAAGEVDVMGGTTWLWSREDMQEAVDVLFVDEAGQISLANVIASAPAAANLVLLGDPQQLDQPLKGVHPAGADRSALAHILGEHHTMPPDLGLFLDGTWRLHPDVCAFTSEVFYDDRLHPQPGREVRKVTGAGVLSGVGLRYIPVEHDGHSSDSEEEALAIRALVSEVLAADSAWVDDKGVEHALGLNDVVVVTPYNSQVQAIAEALPGIRVGTVDKFQGQEAPISIYSMATSSAEEAPRGMEFLYSLNRLNVATSRASCVAGLVASPNLIRVRCRTPRQMQLANALARLVEMANPDRISSSAARALL